MSKLDDGLNEKQRAFVEFYTGEAEGNGVKAARLAGYGGGDASLASQASSLLRVPKVARAIEAATRQVRSKAIATRRERQDILTRILRDEVDEEVVLTVGTGLGMSQIEKTKKKIGGRERLKAIELLGKMQGDFIDRLEVKSTGWIQASLESVRKRVAAGEFKHLSMEAFSELLSALAEGRAD